MIASSAVVFDSARASWVSVERVRMKSPKTLLAATMQGTATKQVRASLYEMPTTVNYVLSK